MAIECNDHTWICWEHWETYPNQATCACWVGKMHCRRCGRSKRRLDAGEYNQ